MLLMEHEHGSFSRGLNLCNAFLIALVALGPVNIFSMLNNNIVIKVTLIQNVLICNEPLVKILRNL